MGTTSYNFTCGCRKTRLLEPKEDIYIEWTVCDKHYVAERDDPMIVEAAKNYRKYWESAMKEDNA